MIKSIVVSAVTAFVVVLVFTGLVGNQSELAATGSRFPYGISADNTSPVAGEVRGKSATVYNASATSSAYVYSGAAGVGGQVIVEDTDAAGCTAIAALNGTVVAQTVTCP